MEKENEYTAVRVKHDLKNKLKQKAKREYRTLAGMVDMILSEAVRDEKLTSK